MAWWNPLTWGGDSRKTGFQSPAPNRRKNISVTFDSAMSLSAYWASARLLTEVVGAMPIRAYDIDPKSSVKKPNTTNHLWRLINFQPNRYQTRTEFIESIMLSIVTWGNSYVAIERLPSGRIISLLPLVASQMRVSLLDDGEVVYSYTDSNSNIKVFASTSIWHVKIFGNGIVGLSPLSYAANSLDTAKELDDRMNVLASNGGKTNGVLTVDQALTEPQRKQVKENFKELEQGNSNELFVLEAGFKYQQTSLSPSDMELLQNRRFQVEDIARFMGVPGVLINDTSSSTAWGSGIEQIMQGFYKLNLRSYLERIESSWQRWLMDESDWGSLVIEFDFDALLRADKTARIEAQSKAVNNALMTPNEGRAEEGRVAKEGGDKLLMNSTLVPVGTTKPTEKKEVNTDA